MTGGVTPDTPEMAREQGITGVSQIEVTLDASGAVMSASVYKSSGSAALDNAALAAARASRYSPALESCHAVGGSYLFRAEFDAQ